jgi:putative ABC transport system permease protein
MIWIENIIVLTGSFIIGILSGVIFSRLFFLIISEMVPSAGLSYYLDYKSFTLTSIVFLAIYISAIFFSRRTIIRLSIIELLKKPRESSKTSGRLVYGIIGVILFLGSFICAILISHHDKFSEMGYMYLIYAVLAFLSMYMILDNFDGIYHKFIRSKKKRYYRNLLSLSEKEYNFKKNKTIIFILSLLSAMFIFFVASPYALLFISRNVAESERDADIQFVQLNGINSIDAKRLNGIVNSGDTSLIREKQLELLAMSYKDGDNYVLKPVISDETFTQINGISSGLKKGELLEVVVTWLPGYIEIGTMEEVTLTAGDVSKNFKVAKNAVKYDISAKGINIDVFPSKTTLVISDADYQELLGELDSEYVGVIRQFDFEAWEKTDSILKQLDGELSNTSKGFKVDSVLTAYKNTKSMFSMMIFFTSFMGILFFIAGGCILFFKQYSDLDYYRKTYKKLSHIGATKRELLQLYASTQREIYFVPIVFSFIISFAFIHMTTFLMGGGLEISNFFKYAVIVTLLYGLIQTLYYFLSILRFKTIIYSELSTAKM